MQRDVEGEAGIRPAKKPWEENEVGSTGNREKFGQALYCAKDDCLKDVHRLTCTLSFGHLHTPEAWLDNSQAYAFVAYAWSAYESKNRTLEGCRGILAPRPGCKGCLPVLSRDTQKKAYPWLSSCHRSAVPPDSH